MVGDHAYARQAAIELGRPLYEARQRHGIARQRAGFVRRRQAAPEYRGARIARRQQVLAERCTQRQLVARRDAHGIDQFRPQIAAIGGQQLGQGAGFGAQLGELGRGSLQASLRGIGRLLDFGAVGIGAFGRVLRFFQRQGRGGDGGFGVGQRRHGGDLGFHSGLLTADIAMTLAQPPEAFAQFLDFPQHRRLHGAVAGDLAGQFLERPLGGGDVGARRLQRRLGGFVQRRFVGLRFDSGGVLGLQIRNGGLRIAQPIALAAAIGLDLQQPRAALFARHLDAMLLGIERFGGDVQALQLRGSGSLVLAQLGQHGGGIGLRRRGDAGQPGQVGDGSCASARRIWSERLR